MRNTIYFAILVVAAMNFDTPSALAQSADLSAVQAVQRTLNRLRLETGATVIAGDELPARPRLWKRPEVALSRKAETFRTALRDVVALAVCETDRGAVDLLTDMVRSLDTLIFTEAEAVFLDHRASELWINQYFTVHTRRQLALIQNSAHRPRRAVDVAKALNAGKVQRALQKIPSFSELCFL